ncbi:MAG TPA: helix-hairpin-helix domain-containing protein [Ohtaekwangia sp.]
MKRFSRFLQRFFGFSRSQANGLVILLPLLILAVFSEPIYRWWVAHRKPDIHDVAMLDSMVAHWQATDATEERITKSPKIAAFDFDPNRVLPEELQQLGFSTSLSRRIIRYREKGGKFRIKSDLLKMYGMDTVLYLQLYDHILLPVTSQVETFLKSESAFEKKTKIVERFDINTADSLRLEEIYGIGPKLSKRIINYREKLGGFVSIDQLKEVWGLDTTVVTRLTTQSFVLQNYVPVQLNLNQATENELSAHPYLSRKTAKAIVAYRFQHGPFGGFEDLRNIQALDINTIQKITPYLKLQN